MKSFFKCVVNHCNKKAFTLAEVLISLVIIGVIAAITVPVLHANYTKEATASKLKKFYAMLHNASTLAKADGSDWEYYAQVAGPEYDDSGNFSDKYLLPYIVYLKKDLKGTFYKIYLNDGTSFDAQKSSCLNFIVDVNADGKPNQGGRDRFLFLYCPNSVDNFVSSGQLIPYLPKTTNTREKALEDCKRVGDYCTGLLSFDNWEFKDDYPYGM